MRPDDDPPAPGTSRAIAVPAASRLVCHGCGWVAPIEEARPFRCPNGTHSDSVDHVLRRVFEGRIFSSSADARNVFLDPEPNPFRRYRSLFYSYEVAKHGGLADSAYTRIVDRLDAAVAAVDGAGFRATPLVEAPALAAAIGLPASPLWIKDETRNVTSSHKARHLMGLAIWLEVARRLGLEQRSDLRLAIASCGNAALAAGVVARSAGHTLEAFVPTNASPKILERLTQLGVELTPCERSAGDPPGDPCLHRFLAAVDAGAVPFSCQEEYNGLTIEGACTLVWEMLSTLMQREASLDHLIIQVGGGALATACVEGLRNGAALGLIERLPRIHTVQTRSAFPLRRAYDVIVRALLGGGNSVGFSEDQAMDFAGDAARALQIRDVVPAQELAEALGYARRHRGDYMWPWETAPQSIAFGILDDETYDWVAVCEGMLETAGVPLVVDELRLAEAHQLSRAHTGINAEPTGTAGLAGLLELQSAGLIRPGESVALLFTGAER